MAFHVRDNFRAGAPVSQIPASHFNAVAALLNNTIGTAGVRVSYPATPSPASPATISLDLDWLAAYGGLVTLSTPQTITGAKTFASSPIVRLANDAGVASNYGYFQFQTKDAVNTGYLVSGSGNGTTHQMHLRAVTASGTHSGIGVSVSADGTGAQTIENPPSADTTATTSNQIATRGWANQYFLRKTDYTVPDLSDYVTITGTQTITGAKKFQNAYLDQLAGTNYGRYRFLSSSTGSEITVAEIIANLYNPALHFRVHNGNVYGGIAIASNDNGFAQQLVAEPSADTTATTSTQIASRGWTNGHFMRKSETATGFVFNNAGAVSYRDFGTTADTVAAGDHTHADYVTYDDLGDAFMEAIEDAQSTFLDDLVTALEAEFTNYVTLSTAQTITGAKIFSGAVTFDTSANATYGYLNLHWRSGLVGRIITEANTVYLRAYNGAYYSGVKLDFNGPDGTQRQVLENEPSHDSGWLNTGNLQIATRGFVYDKYATKGHTHTLSDIAASYPQANPCMLAIDSNGMFMTPSYVYTLLLALPIDATKLLTNKDYRANGGTLLTTDDLDPAEVLTTDDLDTNGGTLLTTDDLDTNGGTIMTTTAGAKYTGNITVATDIQWTGSVLKYTPVTLAFSNGLCESRTSGSSITIDTPTVITWS